MPDRLNASSLVLLAVAGCLGAAGVLLAAAAAHVGGGEALRAAAELALVNAAVAIALVALSQQSQRPGLWRIVTGILLTGSVLFSATVALGVLADFRPLPMLAPIGGTLSALAWLAISGAAVWEWVKRSP